MMTNVNNVSALNPIPTEKVLFELREYLKVPQISGCYVLATDGGVILYIGQTCDLHRRFQEHADDPQKTRLTTEGKAVWFFYLLCEANDLDMLENTWLNHFEICNGRLPILN